MKLLRTIFVCLSLLVSPPAISGDENFFGWTWWDIVTLPFSRGGPFGPDDEDRTPLEFAVDQPENSPRALKNKLSRINKLLQKEPAPTTKDLNLALVRASYNSSAVVIQRLLDAGAEVNARLDNNAFLNGESPLIRASFNPDSSVARLLLDAGANPNIKRFMVSSGEGASALMVAARVGNLDMIKLLLAHGAEVNYRHNNCSGVCGTTLIEAIRGHSYDTKDAYGVKDSAIDKRYEEIVQLLLEYGADANLAVGYQRSPDEPLPHTPLVTALDENGSIFVPLLLNHGAQVNRQSNGTWPLTVAAGNGDAGSVGLLLARGADVRAIDMQGHNALVAAFKCYGCLDKKLDMIEQLLAAGAPVNARNGGLSTTLIEAIIGARATIRASGGISTEALREQESKIMLRLIELGADLNTVDKDGNTALAMAREDKFITVVGEIERRMQASATDHPKSSQ